MNISVSDQAGVRKVSVLGTAVSAEDVHRIVNACITTTAPCEVSFFDAPSLPNELIEGLAFLLQSGRAFRIYTYELALMHTLARLGFPVIQMGYHTLRSRGKTMSALVIGGSAESLHPLLYLIERLPVSPLTIFIVQHILDDHENILDQLLRVRTEYAVIMPTHLMPVRPSTIYIAPPGHHLKVAHGQIYLTRDAKVQFARPSLDALFESVAFEYGQEAVAVVLCGFGWDGVAGSVAIREQGGWVVVEESTECHGATLLPNAVKEKGSYDFILDRAGLTCFLASLVGVKESAAQSSLNTGLVDLLLKAIQSRYGYDFSDYQSATVARRIQRLMSLLDVSDFFTLQLEILSDPAIFEMFLVEMSVAVTEFFRHPQQLLVLREEVLPYLDTFPMVKIWSAGCATGEEIYSLAIVLDELGMLEKSILFATDMNPHVLRQAEAGFFPMPGPVLEKGRANYLQAGGTQDLLASLDDCCGMFFKASQRIRKRIFFHRHSLIHDGVFNEFQLILCRNVLIYFKPSLQCEVINRFARSLHRDGFLMLGPTEPISQNVGDRFFVTHHREQRIYRCR